MRGAARSFSASCLAHRVMTSPGRSSAVTCVRISATSRQRPRGSSVWRDTGGKAKDAAGYIRESIIDPNAYIVPGPNYRTPDGQSVMPKDFAQTLSARDLNDVVAFLLTRT